MTNNEARAAERQSVGRDRNGAGTEGGFGWSCNKKKKGGDQCKRSPPERLLFAAAPDQDQSAGKKRKSAGSGRRIDFRGDYGGRSDAGNAEGEKQSCG